MNTNLFKEIKQRLEDNHQTLGDVEWIGSRNGKWAINKQDWERVLNVDYDNGFGAAYIASDLVVVGQDFWLERVEYDGSEGFEYKTMPQMQFGLKTIERVSQDGELWPDIERLHSDDLG